MDKWVTHGIAGIAREMFAAETEEGREPNHAGFPLGVSMRVKRERRDIWDYIYQATNGLDPHQTISTLLPKDVTDQLAGKVGELG